MYEKELGNGLHWCGAYCTSLKVLGPPELEGQVLGTAWQACWERISGCLEEQQALLATKPFSPVLHSYRWYFSHF